MTLEEAHKLNRRIQLSSSPQVQARLLKMAVDGEVRKEREACAKIAEDSGVRLADKIARAIRARNKPTNDGHKSDDGGPGVRLRHKGK